MDPGAHHISACTPMYSIFSNTLRHDFMVKGLAEIARQCGFDAGVHEGPIFRDTYAGIGPRLKPADWYEADADLTAHPGGVALDLTVRTCGRDALQRISDDKRRKYAEALRHHPTLGFSPFAVSHTGYIGAEAESTIRRWAARLRTNRRHEGIPGGQPLEEVAAAVGFSFAVVMTSQAQAYFAEVTDDSSIPGPLRRITRTGRMIRWLGWKSPGLQEGPLVERPHNELAAPPNPDDALSSEISTTSAS